MYAHCAVFVLRNDIFEIQNVTGFGTTNLTTFMDVSKLCGLFCANPFKTFPKSDPHMIFPKGSGSANRHVLTRDTFLTVFHVHVCTGHVPPEAAEPQVYRDHRRGGAQDGATGGER